MYAALKSLMENKPADAKAFRALLRIDSGGFIPYMKLVILCKPKK